MDRYNERIDPDVVLEVFEQRDDKAEPITASDVIEEIEIARRTAHNKLNALTERGVLETKKVGARGRVWWKPISESPREGQSMPENPPEPEDDVSPEHTEQQAKDALQEIDVTGRGSETKEVRREAILHAWRVLRKEEEATTQELANAAFDEYENTPRFGYSASASHYRGYTFWDSCARDAIKELPGVESPPERGNTWRFIG